MQSPTKGPHPVIDFSMEVFRAAADVDALCVALSKAPWKQTGGRKTKGATGDEPGQVDTGLASTAHRA